MTNKICACKGDQCICAYGKSADKVTDVLILAGGTYVAYKVLNWLFSPKKDKKD
jgi:hypothetical protein